MKQQLYLLGLLLSLGTIGVVAMHPKIVEQGTALLGLASSPPKENLSDTERLNNFMKDYPFKNMSQEVIASAPVPPRLEPPVPTPVSLPVPVPTYSAPPVPPQPEPSLPILEPLLPAPPVLEVLAPPSPPLVVMPETIEPPASPEPAAGFATTQPPAPPFAIDDVGFARTNNIPSHTPTNPVALVPAEHYPMAANQAAPLASNAPPTVFPVLEYSQPNTPPLPTLPPLIVSPTVPDRTPEPLLVQNPVPVPPQEPYVPLSPVPPVGPPMPSPSESTPQMQVHQTLVPPPGPPQVQVTAQEPTTEVLKVYGTETIARVGTQVILMCDVLPQLRRMANMVIREQLKGMPQEKQASVSKEELDAAVTEWIRVNYADVLEGQISIALIYNDFVMSRGKEDRERYIQRFNEEFDREDIARMIKEYGVRDVAELKRYWQAETGGSLEQEKMQATRTKIAQQWMLGNTQDAEKECTHSQMMDYYTQHKDEFTTQGKSRWQELVVYFKNHGTEQEARDKIAWMGNQVVKNNIPFETVAKEHSEGASAKNGGNWDWITEGSLTSPELEKAVFSLPVNTMSSIIRTERGFYIIRVPERFETTVKPFQEAQIEIKNKIKQERRQRFQNEYLAGLRKKYPVMVLQERLPLSIMFQAGVPSAVQR